MAINVEDSFAVQAPPDRVWAYLIDAERVVRCLPGAELLDVEEDGTFVGQIKVKVGPVTAAYKGRARFVETDEEARVARLSGRGQETSGGGSASMTMTSRITETDNGGSEVAIEVEMDVVGKLVQFGRGMIEEVSKQVFRQFAACVRDTLETEARAGGSGNAGGSAEDAGGSAEDAGGSAEDAEAAFAGAGGAAAGAAASADAPASGESARSSGAGAASVAPVSAVDLMWGAFKARLRRWLGRGEG